MKIVVEGCAHGELETIYDAIALLEEQQNIKIDLLICCGDFQATRNQNDLDCMAVPQKYRSMCTFHKYYSGEKRAPVLTLFIGGNHEASNHLQELPFGGWVAPRIFYLGYAGVFNVGGLRIAGISGIYKPNDYLSGHFERPPYSGSTVRSVYHIRSSEVFRLKQVKSPIDIFISHDWPTGITKYGNESQLIRFKPHFKADIESGKLGSPPCEELLKKLKPAYWFSAHLHCKFAALVPHKNGTCMKTKFLALDKCLPGRKFMQVLDIPHDESKSLELEYDLEWLTILHFTNHLSNIKNETVKIPEPDNEEDRRHDFTPTEVEKEFILAKIGGHLEVPNNFVQTVPPHSSPPPPPTIPVANPQTTAFCNKIGITDLFAEVLAVDPPPFTGRQSWTPQELPDPSTPLSSFIDSETGDDSSFDISTPNSKSGWDNSSPRLGSLSLPPPKNEGSPSPAKDQSSVGESDTPKSSRPLEDCKELFFEDTEPMSSPASTPIGPKKFKRRNQEIYTDHDDS